MGSDTGGVVGKIKEKAQKAYEGLTGSDDTVGDADPDLEYEPAPNQTVLHDGMVVLSEGQSQDAGVEDGSDSSTDTDSSSDTDGSSDTDSGSDAEPHAESHAEHDEG